MPSKIGIKQKFIKLAREYSYVGVPFILKGGFPKDEYIPLGEVHKQINLTIDKVKQEAEKVRQGLLSPYEAKTGALIQIPRRHSKTHTILCRLLWELGKNPNLIVKVVCASEELAKKRIAFLRTHIEANKNLHLLFPHLKPHPSLSWSTTQLYVQRDIISVDPSIEACGVLGTHTGSHCILPDTLIITNKGLKPIQEIKVGDFVKTHTGEFHRVIATAKHKYDGDICCLKSSKGGIVRITKDHKVLAEQNSIVDWFPVFEISKNSDSFSLVFPSMIDAYVSDISWQYFDGYVYDLQVEEDHSFCSSFIALKNCDVILFDDIVDFKSAFVYPENLKKIESAVKENWLNILKNDGWFVAIFTPWTKEDVTLKMKQQTDLYYVFERMIDENYTPVWPEKYTRDMLKREEQKIGVTAFLRGYRGILPESTTLFREDAIAKCYDYDYSFGEYPEGTMFFIGVDLGHRAKKDAPQTCIFTLGITPDKKRIPVSIKVGNYTSTQAAHILLQEARKYNPQLILVENNGYQQSFLEWIKTLDDSADLPIEGYFTGSQKMNPNTGIPSLAVEFEKGMWILPMKDFEQEHSEFCKCGYCTFLSQLKTYPHSGFSDAVMACFFALQAYKKMYQSGINVRVLDIPRQPEYKEHDSLEEVVNENMSV